jgi:hypothetical protein
MSSPLSPNERIRFLDLVQTLCNDEITDGETAELHQTVQRSDEAAWIYVQYMNLFAGLHWDKMQGVSSEQRTSIGSAQPERSPVLGFLDDALRRGGSFLSDLTVFSLMVTVGLPGLVLLVLVLALMWQTPPQAPVNEPMAVIAHSLDSEGGITDGDNSLSVGTELFVGQKIQLEEGLLEIVFASGTRAVLEAPTTFDIHGGNSGFLRTGRLAATVPPRAHGFRIDTPVASVVDLGTDFGVSVAADGTSEAHVFDGEIEVAARAMPAQRIPTKERFRVGEATRIRPAGKRKAPRVERIAASTDEFVRRLPPALSTRRPQGPAAGARFVQTVNRRDGITHSRVPVGSFDGETNPLKADPAGLRSGAPLFSDRVYVIDDISPELVGADYVRTFLEDKKDAEQDYAYEVTFASDRDKVFLMVLVDDRFGRRGARQQDTVDAIVSKFAKPGAFVDTGFDIDASDSFTPHPLSAFGMMVPTKDELGRPITYVFSAAGEGESTFVIAAMSTPPGKAEKTSRDKK